MVQYHHSPKFTFGFQSITYKFKYRELVIKMPTTSRAHLNLMSPKALFVFLRKNLNKQTKKIVCFVSLTTFVSRPF